MPLPDPQPGLVICYSYLWRHEDRAGEMEGRKNRPCAIISAVTDRKDGSKIVTVVPVTHTEPADQDGAIEIPAKTKERLGLDEKRSWIVCSEINQFIWPGPDLKPVSARKKDQFEYGFLPPGLFRIVKNKVIYLARGRKLKVITRSE